MSTEPEVLSEADEQASNTEEAFNPTMLIFICAIVAAAIVFGLLFT